MSEKSTYKPPCTITPEILNRVAAISEAIGRLTVLTDQTGAMRLRRINRIRTIHGSLAIEGNSLSEAQITAILVGKRVIAPPREVQEVKNALAAYDRFDTWKPEAEKNLLDALTASAPQVTPQVTPQVGELLGAIQGEMTREALQAALGLSDRKSFRERYLKPALVDGLIEMTIPGKPNSRLQKYRHTDKGCQWLAQHGDG